ncbi:SpoIIE family protein phosphatase [Streptomyces albus subsp. chlorinus]|uniref:PP2C family protein-serine/threonine phosphatase n=1 Tax=Streptomyces albus TaxID=1888 RepID=UPI00157026FB|nr:PP2C family protein-serine/threonine phosphatase [Streptomyces albus]NSC20192.1 SpoIIE family protein phosphatase [Streptomyces albus subsp. chlorinus]
MTRLSTPLTSPAQVRQAARRIADEYGLPLVTRARLAHAAEQVARPLLARGQPVRLRDRYHPPGGAEESGELVVTLTAPAPVSGPGRRNTLPLPAQRTGNGEAEWRLALPSSAGPRTPWPPDGAGGAEGDDGAFDEEKRAAEEETRALLAELDGLQESHRRLNEELAETNSGVLALYVQLEERDEQLRRAHGQMLRELEDALRPAPPHVPGLELAVHYAPADTDAPTGGDLYDWFTMPDGTVHITVVDALGHGVRSTRSALNVTHAVRTLALEGHPPKDIVQRVSEILQGIDPELMATLLLARLAPATGDLMLANGSHPPALLVHADGSSDYLETPGRGIGFPMPGSEEVLHTRLAPGDLLVLYTDGLTESLRDPLEGERRLADSARRHLAAPITDIPGAIATDMHTQVLHQDDTLALALRLAERAGSGTGEADGSRD